MVPASPASHVRNAAPTSPGQQVRQHLERGGVVHGEDQQVAVRRGDVAQLGAARALGMKGAR